MTVSEKKPSTCFDTSVEYQNNIKVLSIDNTEITDATIERMYAGITYTSGAKRKFRIAIVGQGLSGFAVVGSLIRDIFKHHLEEKIKIYWIGDSQEVGRGYPFASWLPSAMVSDHEIFNTGDYSFTDTKQKMDDYLEWSKSKKLPTPDYPSRRQYGNYLQEQAEKMIYSAHEKGIDLEVMSSTQVNDVKTLNNEAILSTSKFDDLQMDSIVLSTGHSRNDFPDLYLNTLGYFREMCCYDDMAAIRHYITSQQVKQVIIRGMSLSAIDLIRWINDEFPKIKILAFSRRGIFPAIRGNVTTYQPEIFTIENLKKENQFQRHFSLESVVAAFCEEVRKAYGGTEIFWHSPLGLAIKNKFQGDYTEALDDLIKEAQSGEIALRSVFLGMREIAQEIYENYLDDEAKRRFQAEFGIYWRSIQSAMPLPVAEQLLKLMKSGQLIFCASSESPSYDTKNKAFQMPLSGGSTFNAEAFLEARGWGQNSTTNTLIQNMSRNALLSLNSQGNIQFNTKNLRVISHAAIPIYVIGPLTLGARLIPSSANIAIKDAMLISQDMLNPILIDNKQH